MQSNPLREQLRQAVSRACPNWDAERILDFRSLPGGYANANHHFTYTAADREQIEAVLRVPHRTPTEADRQAFKLELDYLRKLAAAQLPVCEVLGAHVPSGVLLTRWCQGKHLHELQRVEALPLLRRLQRTLAALPAHGSHYDPLAQFYILDGVPDWLQALAVHCQRWLASQRSALRSCHNDLNPFNLIQPSDAPSSLLVLDWEMAGQNLPGFDLVTAWLGIAREGLIQFALAERELKRQLGAPSADSLICCYWLREWAWTRVQQQLGNAQLAVRQQEQLALTTLQTLSLK